MADQSVQLNFRLSPKERDDIVEAARFSGRTMSAFLREAALGAATGKLVPVNDCEGVDDPVLDPMLARLFSDHRDFNILEWITDEPGKGEQTMMVGAKVRGSTVAMVDRIVQDPRCPYATRSELLRDVLLTGAYVIVKGRFRDDEAAEFAAQERARGKATRVHETRVALAILLKEFRAYVDDPNGQKAERALDKFVALCKLIEKDVTLPVAGEAMVLARYLWGHVTEADRPGLKERFPDIAREMK